LLIVSAAVVAALFNRSLSRPAWYVEPGLEEQWTMLLETAPTPPPFTRMAPYGGGSVRKGRSGVLITRAFPLEEDREAPAQGDPSQGDSSPEQAPWEPPLRIYPGLYRDRADYQGAIPLALDPWLVIRKTGDPPLTLERALGEAGGAGILILPGAEAEAEAAWISQLLQDSPGSFPAEQQAWENAQQRLVYGNNRFQQGALTYTWYDSWIRLLQNEPAWLYAPLSRTRGLASYDRGRLDAASFPIPGDWNTYGLQADLLWAVPGGSWKQEALLDETRRWLASAEVQSVIADSLGWIPAESGAVPFDSPDPAGPGSLVQQQFHLANPLTGPLPASIPKIRG
jgi:hypothetical protein